jgi:hypothetical protein
VPVRFRPPAPVSLVNFGPDLSGGFDTVWMASVNSRAAKSSPASRNRCAMGNWKYPASSRRTGPRPWHRGTAAGGRSLRHCLNFSQSLSKIRTFLSNLCGLTRSAANRRGPIDTARGTKDGRLWLEPCAGCAQGLSPITKKGLAAEHRPLRRRTTRQSAQVPSALSLVSAMADLLCQAAPPSDTLVKNDLPLMAPRRAILASRDAMNAADGTTIE